MSILDLSPREFLAALDELGLSPEERERLTGLYREQNSVFAGIRTRLQAKDSDLADQGMRRGSIAPIAFPESRTGIEALRSGDWRVETPSMPGEIALALMGAVETPRDLLSGVPISRGESEQAAMTAAELAVPGSLAVRGVDRVVDRSQRNQAARLFEETRPEFPGAPYADSLFYHPSSLETSEILGRVPGHTPTPAQEAFLQMRREAAQLRREGVSSPELARQTGILSVPRQTMSGEDFGPRPFAALSRDEFEMLRPERADNYNIPISEVDMRGTGYEGVYYDPPFEAIELSTGLDAATRNRVLAHELTHADIKRGEVADVEVGTNISDARRDRKNALRLLREKIRRESDPDRRSALIRQRDDIRRATGDELYQRNPGEMLARLSEGDPTTLRALTTTELANPYIRPSAGAVRRYGDAFMQSLFSERSGLVGRFLPEGYTFDRHKRVPMDLNKALIPDPPRTFEEGGMVNGLAPLSRAETIEAYTPTLRDRARGGIQSLVGALGGSPGYASQVARDVAGSPEAFGVMDLSPAGGAFAVQEGTRAAVRGARAGDSVAAGIGAGEALLAVTPFGPAARTARTMAPSGTGRGSKPPQVSDPRSGEQVKPDVSRRSKELDYKFTREFDPVTGKQKTVIQPRTSGMQEGATARRVSQQSKAAPVAGGDVDLSTATEARYTLDPATGRYMYTPPQAARPTPTAGQRMAAAESPSRETPTEFRLVRAPLGSSAVSTPRPQRTVEYSPGGRQLDQAATERFTPAKAEQARRVSPEQAAGDPGHEWLEVPAEALNKLNFNPANFTDPASRMSPDGTMAYLASGPDTRRFLQGWRSQAEFFGLPKQPTLKAPTALPDTSVFSFPPTAAPAAPRPDRGPGIVRSEGPPPKSRWFE